MLSPTLTITFLMLILDLLDRERYMRVAKYGDQAIFSSKYMEHILGWIL